MLICPNCQTRLSRAKSSAGVSFVCRSCAGRTTTVESLKKTVPGETVNSLWQEALARSGAPKRHCPSCNHLMAEVAIKGASHDVYLDVCTGCHLVWFDATEYEMLPHKPTQKSTKSISPVSAEAREKMAKIKIKLIEEQSQQQMTGRQSPDALWKYLPAIFGMPVEFDSGILQRFPWVTWLLTLIISFISILAFNDLRNVVAQYGLIPADYGRFSGLTFLTSFFLHGGILHLVGNMYFLLVFGDNVEDVLGKGRYLGLLIFAALLGDIAHIMADPTSPVPCIGASGGISGIIVFYAFKFPNARLGFLLFFRWFRMPASVMLFLWILLQIYGVFRQTAGVSSVSSIAHLGGAAAGFIFYLMSKKKALVK